MNDEYISKDDIMCFIYALRLANASKLKMIFSGCMIKF